MTDAPTVPAAWYPNPDGTPTVRWWDGTAWTDNVQPAVSTPSLTAPEGTQVYTVWIWLMLGLWTLSALSIFLVNPADIASRIDIFAPNAAAETQRALWTSPASVIQTLFSWSTLAAAIAFAVLDWRALKRNGVPRPFHWAFIFLGYVYPIGRAVVTHRRAKRGLVILWLTIGVFVVSVTSSLVWNAILTTTILDSIR